MSERTETTDLVHTTGALPSDDHETVIIEHHMSVEEFKPYEYVMLTLSYDEEGMTVIVAGMDSKMGEEKELIGKIEMSAWDFILQAFSDSIVYGKDPEEDGSFERKIGEVLRTKLDAEEAREEDGDLAQV